MYESIVVTLDGSELAQVALPYAEELMGNLGSTLTLLHICDGSEVEERRRYFATLAQEIEARAKMCHGLPHALVEAVVLAGNPADEIVDYIEANAVDLTMMATHGRSGITRWALGSVADKVLRGACRPLALIRARETQADVCLDGLFGRIFTPLDGSEEGEAALPYVKELAIGMNSKVILFQAIPEDLFEEEVSWIELRKLANENAKAHLYAAGQWLKSAGVDVKYDVRFGNPAALIIDAASRTMSDILAMSTHGRSGIDRWVFGSVAEKVLRGGTTPVLLIRSHDIDNNNIS